MLPGGRISCAARAAAALLLLAAAAGKSAELWSAPTIEVAGLALPRWLAAIAIAGETALAAWLLAGIRSRIAASVAAILFAAFACISLASAWSGALSCGCFGRIAVHPLLTASVDAIVAAGLLRTWRDAPTTPRRYARSALTACAAAACALGVVLTLHRPGIIAALPGLQAATADPQPEVRIARGQWVVVLFRRSCPDCREHLAEWWDLAESDALDGTRNWAFIEVEAEPGSADPLAGRSSDYVQRWRTELPRSRTPQAWLVQDGIIRRRGKTPIEVL